MQNLKRILVPIDFSECSLAAVDWAALLAVRFGAEIDVLHVWNISALELWTPYPPEGIDRHLFRYQREEAGSTLKEILEQLKAAGVTAHARVDSGDPLRTILRCAAEEGHDVIVMGTHGRTGMSHFLLGSVAESVVRRAPCPVLTIRHEQRRERAVGEAEPETRGSRIDQQASGR